VSDDEGKSARRPSIASREVVRVGTREDEWAGRRRRCHAHDANFTLHGPDGAWRRGAQRDRAHNVADAAGRRGLAAQLGVSSAAIRSGLANFVGAPRRFELLGSWRGVDVYESYAHLPGEITAILSATRAAGYERITAVFQPHRVTRTLALVEDFAPSFDLASTVIVTTSTPPERPIPRAVTAK